MTLEDLLKQLLGPFGLTVGLIVVVVWIGRLLVSFVKNYIDDLKAQIVELIRLLNVAQTGWAEQTKASQTLADAQASRNRDDEMRHRLADAKANREKKVTT